MLKPRLLIIGGSYGALNTAAAARAAGFDGAIAIVSEERVPPYQRPPLSKAFLKGQASEADLPLKGEGFYRDQQIELILGEQVTALDLHAGRVELATGGALPFDSLVLACGARARRLPADGTDNILYLRSLEDARLLKERLGVSRSVIILGGGFIGLEVASAAAAMGLRVQLVQGNSRLLARAVPPEISAHLAERHRNAGVEIVSGVALKANGGRVSLADGRVLEADLVVAGLGAIPNTELAAAAGLATQDGIEVDEHSRTALPNIYAVGDCSNHANLWAGRRMRLESVQNAVDQGRAVGTTIAGHHAPYHAAPRFWSDQYEVKLQMVGLSAGADREQQFLAPTGLSMLHIRDEAVIGVTSINDLRTQVWARKSLAQGPIALSQIVVPEHLALQSELRPG